MKPLQPIGYGLLLVLATVLAGRFDLLPNPVGWALVVVGVAGLRDRLPSGTPVVAAALTAGAVSVPLWVPAVADVVADADPALGWALSLPQVVFLVLFYRALDQLARAAGDLDAGGWLRIGWVGAIVVGALPAVLLPLGVSGPPVALAGVFSLLVGLLQVVLAFAYSGRAWAARSPSTTSPPR